MKVRAFICVPILDEIRDRIARIADTLAQYTSDPSVRRALRPVHPRNYHITLKFLDDIQLEEIPEIAEAMRQAIAGIDPFEVVFKGFGGLPRVEKPRIVYAAVEDSYERLTGIVKDLEQALPHIPREHKRYIPHVTFMRIKQQKAWPGIARHFEGLWGEHFGEQQVTCLNLMQSELRPSGPDYSLLERVEL